MKKISAIEMAMNLVGGKYKCLILYHLSGGAKRTRDLLLLLEGISSKVLTEQLRQLEKMGSSNALYMRKYRQEWNTH